jgi:hypothetical protein
MKYRIKFSNGISTLLDYNSWDCAHVKLTKILGYTWDGATFRKYGTTAIIECKSGIPF